MKKIAFIDRDGTIIIEPQDIKQVNGLERLEFLPNVISSLKKLQDSGFEFVVVSNQDGLGSDNNPQDNYDLINAKIMQILESENIKISKWLTCPHYENDNCDCRKPKIGLIDFNFDKEESVIIGDRDSDIQFAKNLSIRGFKITQNFGWKEIMNETLSRKAEIIRQTKETNISINLNLDGSGNSKIDTGLKFFDHMLEQIAKHGNFDLEIQCKGDLEIDEHHTIEDVAICLGDSYRKAIGDKKGIARFASERIVPLDEAISFISVDISGRPFCKFDGKFQREYCGDMPTEMISHFFQSFSVSAAITLHIKIEGKNTHHKIESCFKAFAKCLYDTSRINGNNIISTKGVL